MPPLTTTKGLTVDERVLGNQLSNCPNAQNRQDSQNRQIMRNKTEDERQATQAQCDRLWKEKQQITARQRQHSTNYWSARQRDVDDRMPTCLFVVQRTLAQFFIFC